METLTPRLLAMFSVLAVFIPSFFMVGIARSLFVPLSLAVGFSMLASYLLSNTLVPVMAAWMLREGHAAESAAFSWLQSRYERLLGKVLRQRWITVGAYVVIVGFGFYLSWARLGTDIFPPVESGMLQLRLRAPTGTRVERTELITLQALAAIRRAGSPPRGVFVVRCPS